MDSQNSRSDRVMEEAGAIAADTLSAHAARSSGTSTTGLAIARRAIVILRQIGPENLTGETLAESHRSIV
jgi:hypothetical protein